MITQNQLPDLPHGQWSAIIRSGFNEIQNAYTKVVELLAVERSTEPTRLQAKLESLRSKHIILRGLMEQGVPREWVKECARLCLTACAALEEAGEAMVGEDRTHYTHPTVVQTIRTGRPGRPRKVITPAILKEAFRRDRKIKIREFAGKMGVGRNLVGKALKDAGLTQKHDHLPPEQLDSLVRKFCLEHPTAGRRYLGGRTLKLGLRIPRKDLVEASNRVDGRLGVALRTHRQIIRRGYKVARPNSVSHTDGYHKLIRYGWVIHGVTDGFSRLITALEVHTNNRASTVLKMFKKATKRYGLPERVRGDRGGENIKVAVYMVRKRGMGRGAFIWGTSTRNTRIERLWVEVGSQFARQWKVFFIRLEDLFGLDVSKEGHLWLLHQLFQEDLNRDCKNFRQDWNSHGISGSLTNGQTPRDLFFMGQLEHGVVGELALLGDSSPEPSSTDSDASSDSEMLGPDQREREEMLETAILADERRNIHHAPREPDDDPNPFHGNVVAEEMFWSFLQHQIDLVHIPDGYPFYPWDEIEEMKVGKRHVDIHLPEELWVPRAIRWARGLESMINCMEMLDSLSDE